MDDKMAWYDGVRADVVGAPVLHHVIIPVLRQVVPRGVHPALFARSRRQQTKVVEARILLRRFTPDCQLTGIGVWSVSFSTAKRQKNMHCTSS